MSSIQQIGFAPPDILFPGWRSIEVFGPPGAGKSYYCRRAREAGGILTTSDDHAVRFLVDRTMWPATARLRDLVGPRVMSNVYHWRKSFAAQRYRRTADGEVAHYFAALRAAIEASALSATKRGRMFSSIVQTASIIRGVYEAGQRVLVDEGIGTKFTRLIARSGGAAVAPEMLSLVARCLDAYPWEKRALFIDASADTAMRRQHARGHVVFGPRKPQAANNVAAEMLVDLCGRSGWQVVRLDNEAEDAAAPATSGATSSPSSD